MASQCGTGIWRLQALRRRRGILAAIALLGAFGAAIVQGPVAQLLPDLAHISGSPSVQAGNREESTAFLVVAGGGAPSYNEIALEKNVQYFQRTLAYMGWNSEIAAILFANGNDGQPTVRYLDLLGRERFKVPEIENLAGAATETNVRQWLEGYPQTTKGADQCPMFFYFTGHGDLNRRNPDDNAMILWEEEFLSVQELTEILDQWPAEVPFITMMAQCYSGSFANLIYEQGDPAQPVALQTRCGFFATVKTRPSVGCTPLVNESDYQDYSSSFFAGLSGRDRVGNPADSADYNQDGRVSFAEAHAFAKVDGETSDWPISTSEAWLQRQASETEIQRLLQVPMHTLAAQSRPEQQYVIESLVDKLGYDLQNSFANSPAPRSSWLGEPQAVVAAYRMRLRMELINVGIENQLRTTGDAEKTVTLDQLLGCESESW